ncbi:MAG: ABC transporter substrate-binding protein [Candidimonas sp.]|nr:MAG: ABC transporter substrate-binding protein [Candidimonas sp.]
MIAVVTLFTGLSQTGYASTPLRVGYWPSGNTLGYGAVLETGNFFKQQGIDAKFVHFADVNGTTRAIAAGAIDLAFGSPAAGSFSLATDGVPVKIILATQPANVEFVVRADSPITSISQLRGKKIAMSPAGSSTASIASAILDLNYGIKPADFTLVPGNEPRLVQYLEQKDVDAAALRNTTLAQLTTLKVKKLGSFAENWQKVTKNKLSVPYNAVAVIRDDWMKANPGATAKVVLALRNALEFGSAHGPAVVSAVKKIANASDKTAAAYVTLWNENYRVSLTPTDQDTLKRMFAIFKESGLLKGNLPAGTLDAAPYEESLKLK